MQPTNIQPIHGYEIEIRVLANIINLYDPIKPNWKVKQALLQLDKDCFFSAHTNAIYELITKLFNQGEDYSFASLLSIAEDDLYNLIYEMSHEMYINSTNLESDVQKLLDYRALRMIHKIIQNAGYIAYQDNTPQQNIQLINEELQKISQSMSGTRKNYAETYEEIADEFLSEHDEDSSHIIIDLQGFPPVPNGALITIAGRSGHGKTFFALQLMDKIIDATPGKQTLYFNLEMHKTVMLERHCKLLGVKGNTRKEIIKNGIHLLLEKNVSLISQPMISIDEIETECRLAAMKQPLSVVVVDYLGLITSKTKSERKDLEQSNIAKRLAAIAIDLKCVVICLIQVNRDFKSSHVGDRCPKPENSSESMGSVHSSSWWIGIDQPQNDDPTNPEFKNLFLVQWRKNRGDFGLPKLQYRFIDGQFHIWQRPFCSSLPKSIPDGF